jgi:hypothetical protein
MRRLKAVYNGFLFEFWFEIKNVMLYYLCCLNNIELRLGIVIMLSGIECYVH